jgi:hypothetical protein
MDAIDPALDLVRDQGGRLRELGLKASLEDVFLELVTAPAPEAVVGASPEATA